ncbi:LysR family transcriptional regulator [Qingshengfaniella alkalisoli]|uniref:LysR family transcriptional regulator n=1 Tax=Qingshengfaniella alkalisoli TaxID=2599296 RepID=A0A5B8J3B1_9RHOB|nr:LysR family transcriptional regulator [Qingshengfaniella alkalisoli]QDY71208.1 LysR family transcriptional regulator [Qingshengfaniella alkalisoli]
MRPRRFLPSLSLLLAFEAVMRAKSVSAAARELDLSQSTVSRLIQNLEAQIGQPLFHREHKRLIPSDAANRYFADISRALDMVQRASMGLATNASGGSLSLAVLPTFGTRWLAPRLSGFFDAHPGVSINLATRVKRFSFDVEPFDAVIFFGAADWPGADYLKLFDESYTACASPGFLARHPIASAEDASRLPLLQLETRGPAWEQWFAGQGLATDASPGMLMDQFSMMIQAAISGLGIALLPDYLAQMEIAEGRLEKVLTPAIVGGGSYWLAWPQEKQSYAPLQSFRDWIAQAS